MKTIQCKVLQSGQPRPYADSIYELELTFSTQSDDSSESRPWARTEDEALEASRIFFKDLLGTASIKRTSDPDWHWYEPYLEMIRQPKAGVFRISVIRAYCD